jgi:formylglycine-generating enzyme required for sulfatase activity
MNQFVAIILPVVIAMLAVSGMEARPQMPVGLPATGRWTNGLGMVFVPVPSAMVCFSIYETRVKDFAAFAATHPQLDGVHWNHALYHGTTPVSAGPDFPVVNVSWNDARAFCAWLTQTERQSGKISGQEVYRLPTDVEWSWAVGIGDRETGATPREKNDKIKDVFPWGTRFPPPPGAGNFADQAALNYFTNWPHIEGYNDGFVTTAPVGSFTPNALGIYDLAGNAMEWCGDFYDESHRQCVLRGGAWINCGPKSLWSSDPTTRRRIVTAWRPDFVRCWRWKFQTPGAGESNRQFYGTHFCHLPD